MRWERWVSETAWVTRSMARDFCVPPQMGLQPSGMGKLSSVSVHVAIATEASIPEATSSIRASRLSEDSESLWWGVRESRVSRISALSGMRAGVRSSGSGWQVFGMTYTYECTDCRHKWDAEQKITADPLTECPKCAKSSARRLISAPGGFVLKGAGWYRDGYGST